MMTQTNWPAPTPPTSFDSRMPTWVRNVLFGAVAFICGGFALVAVMNEGSSSSKGGSFYASAGWTINRAADLSVKIEYDDGATKATADCAMKEIVGGMTWSAWSSLPPTDKQVAITLAKNDC